MKQNKNCIPVRQHPPDDRREGLLGLLRLVAKRVVQELKSGDRVANCSDEPKSQRKCSIFKRR